LIGTIRRVLRGSDEEDTSRHLENRLQPDAVMKAVSVEEETLEQQNEVQGGVFAPNHESEVERQAEVVRAAMQQGGRFGDREIPIPWLRRILAGLEGRHIDEEAMWEGIASPPRKDPVEESAGYQEIFPSPG
jgi:hypothetical protein